MLKILSKTKETRITRKCVKNVRLEIVHVANVGKTRITISAENKQGNTGVQIRVGNLFACIVDTGTITTVGTEPIVSIVVVTVQ